MPDEWPRQPLVMRADARAPEPTNRRTLRPSLVIAVFSALAALGPLPSANAQREDQPHISVSPAIAAPAGSQISLAIQIGPPEVLPKSSFVSVRGLPPGVSLTEGRRVAPGSWAIPLVGLPTLKAKIAADISGRAEIVISLIGMDGSLLAEARTVLVVESAAMLPSQEKAPPEPAQSRFAFVTRPSPSPAPAAKEDRNASVTAPRPPELSAEEKARAERLLARGEEHLASGNVAGARDFFERAADAGLAAAALRLAATYDPVELQRLQARGIVPDRALARKWYERARDLGAPEAVERLARLGGT